MEFEKARAYGEEALMQCEKNGVKIFVGDILSRLGFIALAQGDLSEAQRYMQKGLILGQELNDKLVTMSAFFGLGEVAYFTQDFKQMETLFQSSFELSQETGALVYQMFSLRNLGIAALRQGKLKQSREYNLKNFSRCERVNWADSEWAKYDIYTFILGMAGIALEIGQFMEAARLLGVVEAQHESFFKPLDLWDKAEYDRIAGEVRHQFDAVAIDSAWSTGRKLSLEEAITEAKLIIP
jgi:tetratricopeptide (TPR) repeat protein